MAEEGDITLSKQGIIQWKITGDSLQRFKNAEFKKAFWSPNFNAIGGEWYFAIYPNGNATEGIAFIELYCASIECKEKELNVSYYVDSVSLEYSQTNCSGHKITKAQWKASKFIVLNPPFLHKDIQNVHELIFRLKLWNTKATDEAEEQFLSNQCPDNKKLPNEWIECAMSQDKQVVRFLAVLGFTEFAPKFEENGLHKMEDLKHLSSEGLTQMGVAKLKDREVIMADVSEYFAVQSKDLDRGVFEWKITGGLMQQFKNAQYKKIFFSPHFKAIGCEWCLFMYPNGYSQQGTAHFKIRCESIASKEVNVSYYVDCVSLEYSQMNCDGNSVKKKRYKDSIVFNPPFLHTDIQNLPAMTLRVKLWHKSCMDQNEERFTSNVLSNQAKKILPNEWIECAMSEDNEISRFLALLGLLQHAPKFQKNKLNEMKQLVALSSDELEKNIGVDALSDRKRIMDEARVYFGIESNRTQRNEESKEMKTQGDCVDNPFVMLFGMGKYNPNTKCEDLDTIINDEECLVNVFKKELNYRFVTNDDDRKYKRKWTPSQAIEWIELMRDNEIIQKGHDSLIFCGASHGSIDAMICSNGEKLKFHVIRSLFAGNVNTKFNDIPKIFIFNCCRTEHEHVIGSRGDSNAVDYSVTITTTEGDKVRGPKLSRCVANAFDTCRKQKMNVNHILGVASQNATDEETKFRTQERDERVGSVVFLERAKARSVDSNTLSNADDDLANLLRPQKNGSKMNLLYPQYYYALSGAEYKDNATLRTLTKEKLTNIDITLVFHQRELLKRVKNL
eukprot:658082_1